LETIALLVPVFENFVDPNSALKPNSTVVGHIFAVLPLVNLFYNMLIDDTEEIAVRISSTCGTDFRAMLDGPSPDVVPVEEWDSSYDHVTFSMPFGAFMPNICEYTISTYATAEFEEEYLVCYARLHPRAVLASRKNYLPHCSSHHRPMLLGSMWLSSSPFLQ
jgi:hypothetical protein